MGRREGGEVDVRYKRRMMNDDEWYIAYSIGYIAFE